MKVEAAGADPPARRLPACTPFVGVSMGRGSDLQREKHRPRVDSADLVRIWRLRSEDGRRGVEGYRAAAAAAAEETLAF